VIAFEDGGNCSRGGASKEKLFRRLFLLGLLVVVGVEDMVCTCSKTRLLFRWEFAVAVNSFCPVSERKGVVDVASVVIFIAVGSTVNGAVAAEVAGTWHKLIRDLLFLE